MKKLIPLLLLCLLPVSLALASPSGLIDQGNQAAAKGDLAKATSLYQKAIASGKLSKANLAVARTNLGCALDDQGQVDQAIAQFNLALKADPSYAQAYYNRSFCFERKNLPKLALEDAMQAVKIAPGDKDYAARLNYLKGQ
ncbi:tetratricopeptide repeat protein [Dethiosulfatarculus sandiegensis]|uniref:Photosystem I assembly protein n=1 Tax=Dethiosulfatarculus sandiegensis TaxID=1429043 RepID=A0A0D2IZH3_9BACT|nr:tetratricopeptide repeat protein [Dethiosulfatarculus sandiegensis]KIX11419.1 photosystem I assembly protein [Dethiosulfatarculus sandiegensis]